MSQLLIRYRDTLTSDELAFLSKKEAEDRSQYYKVARIAMILSFVFPFIIAWIRALKGEGDDPEHPFTYWHYFTGVVCLLLLTGVSIYIAYRKNLHKIQADIAEQAKFVEQTHIKRKQFMPHNQTWHFYIDSPERISIEVSQQDYDRLDIGDELSIEFSYHARIYLGYF